MAHAQKWAASDAKVRTHFFLSQIFKKSILVYTSIKVYMYRQSHNLIFLKIMVAASSSAYTPFNSSMYNENVFTAFI